MGALGGVLRRELDELHLPFAFQLIETPWRAPDLADAIDSLEPALPDGAWPILALGNHDRRRLATRLGRHRRVSRPSCCSPSAARPTLLYGDELGMVDQPVPRQRQRDYFGLSGGVSHDPTRTPMPWTAAATAGSPAPTRNVLWLPVCVDYETLNVEAQLARRRLELESLPAAARGAQAERRAAARGLPPASRH